MEEQEPRIEIQQSGNITEVILLDKDVLDELTINEITDSIFAVVEDKAPIKLVLNFKEVRHLSSSALGALIRINKRIEETQGAFRLSNIKSSLYDIFVITKLNKVFKIFDDAQSARESF
jgi:anti-sigma B factor antagonist